MCVKQHSDHHVIIVTLTVPLIHITALPRPKNISSSNQLSRHPPCIKPLCDCRSWRRQSGAEQGRLVILIPPVRLDLYPGPPIGSHGWVCLLQMEHLDGLLLHHPLREPKRRAALWPILRVISPVSPLLLSQTMNGWSTIQVEGLSLLIILFNSQCGPLKKCGLDLRDLTWTITLFLSE